MRHGDFTLYETSAIMRYVDEAFDGPRAPPTEPQGPRPHGAVDQRHQLLFRPAMIRRLVVHMSSPAAPTASPTAP